MNKPRDERGRFLPLPVPADRAHTCGHCRTPLDREQRVRRQRYCSRSCGAHHPDAARWPGRECAAVLGLLAASRGPWWITLSDLAILRYGDDRERDLKALASTIMRLRKQGYRIETRRLPWPTLDRSFVTGYRLVSAVQEVAA